MQVATTSAGDAPHVLDIQVACGPAAHDLIQLLWAEQGEPGKRHHLNSIEARGEGGGGGDGGINSGIIPESQPVSQLLRISVLFRTCACRYSVFVSERAHAESCWVARASRQAPRGKKGGGKGEGGLWVEDRAAPHLAKATSKRGRGRPARAAVEVPVRHQRHVVQPVGVGHGQVAAARYQLDLLVAGGSGWSTESFPGVIPLVQAAPYPFVRTSPVRFNGSR